MDGRWINLKVPFRKFSGHMQTNLRGAVELLGLVWEGQEHCGLDDARNTAYLALELVKKGIILKVTNSFKTYADYGSKLYIPKLRKPKAMPRPFKNAETNAEEVETTIDHNFANIMCFCGVKSKKWVVKKPGPTQGRSFFSCGKWTTDGKCLFFLWAPS
jgi:ERI1 exoribonuclease 2